MHVRWSAHFASVSPKRTTTHAHVHLQVFGEIMIDYDYVECSSSALQALCQFREQYPAHRRGEVERAIQRCIEYVGR